MQAGAFMSWADVLADVSLHDLPYEIELSAQGQIVVTLDGSRTVHTR